MNCMNSNRMNILDLPDEILCIIVNKLSMVDVFYSLVDVNQRLNRLAFDHVYIHHHVDFVVRPSRTHFPSSPSDPILEQICSNVLPRINSDVYQLTVEPCSAEDVLGIVDYPHLYYLSLINFPAETLLPQLTGHTRLVRLLTDQITKVCVDSSFTTTDNNQLQIFSTILSVGKRLCELTIRQYILKNISNANLPRTSWISSTLTKLNISVHSLDDCLYLLDGRLEYLSTLIIKIKSTSESFSIRENKEKLPRLKCFSLCTAWLTLLYKEQIVPLLRRMSNLEELSLRLSVLRFNSTFIDGKELNDDVLSSMGRLEKFSFSIHTQLINQDVKTLLPSSNDIRNSFFQLGYNDIDAFGDVNFVRNTASCHIYSLPYQFKMFSYMISAFQGGKFDRVRTLIMSDQRPFEHRLFQIIARDFPFLQSLHVKNPRRQRAKDHSYGLVTFNHLSFLGLLGGHTDYVREFLCNENIALPRLEALSITYEVLTTVTDNFTNNQARRICSRIKKLFCEPFVRPSNFHLYFPLLEIKH